MNNKIFLIPVLFLLTIVLSYNLNALTLSDYADNLTHCYPFDTHFDDTLYTINLTNSTGARLTTTDCEISGCVDFDGTAGNNVGFPTYPLSGTEGTVEFLIKSDAVGAATFIFGTRHQAAGGYETPAMRREADNEFTFWWANAVPNAWVISITNAGGDSDTTSFHSMLIRWNSTASGLWWDATQIGTGAAAIGLGTSISENGFLMGTDGRGTSHLNGRIDEVKIWNKSLSNAAILELNNSGDFSSCADVSPPLDTTPAGLLSSDSAGCTSCIPYQNLLNQPWKTTDTTPTINATADESLSGASIIANLTNPGSYNMSDMIDKYSGTACTGSGAGPWSCTVSGGNAIEGVGFICVAFNDTSGNQDRNASFCANITADATAPIVNTSLNISITNIRKNDVVNISANITDNVELSFCQVIINQSGYFEYFNYSLSGTADKCSKAVAITVSVDNVINFTVRANDTLNHWTTNDTIITVVNKPPSIPTIIYPIDNSETKEQPLDLNVTFSADIDGDTETIYFYINSTLNQSSLTNVTFNASDGVYNLNVSLFDGTDSSISNATVTFTLDTTPPIISNLYDKSGIGTNKTTDTTPSINLTTNENADCNMSITNSSPWFLFSNTGGTGHTGTLPDSQAFSIGKNKIIYVNCTDSLNHSGYANIIYNITDGISPVVNLIVPENNSYYKIGINNTNIQFSFNFTDNHFRNASCNLTINGIEIYYNSTVLNGTNTTYVYSSLSLGADQYWNVSCVDAHNNTNSSRKYFTVEQVASVYVNLNNLNQSRKYEFRTKANITANCTSATGIACNVCVNLTAPYYGGNYSCGVNSTSFVYNITVLRQNVSDYENIYPLICYQEQANESTSCGGLATGKYSIPFTDAGLWASSGWQVIDGDYSTRDYGKTNTAKPNFFVNYTKPHSSLNAVWQVKDGDGVQSGTVNLTLLSSCWNYNDSVIVLRGQSYRTSVPTINEARWYCRNSSGWQLLRAPSASQYLYEEGIWWNMPNETITIIMDNRTKMISTNLNITSVGTTINLKISYYGQWKNYTGDLIGKYLKNTNFIHSGIYRDAVNLTYKTGGSNYIYTDIPANINNLTWQLSGFDLDQENEFSYTEYFNGTSGFNETLDYQVDAPLGIWDNFINISYRWYHSGCTTFNYKVNNRLQASTGGTCDITYQDAPEADMRNTSRITILFNIKDYLTGLSHSFYIYAFDGISSVPLYSRGYDDHSWHYVNITMISSDSINWKVISNYTGISNVDISSLNFDNQIILKFFLDEYYIELDEIQWGGAWLNKSTNNATFKSKGNITSIVLNVTKTNISRAMITTAQYEPANTKIDYYLSNNCLNPTPTFESVQSGLMHVFTTQTVDSNKLCWRAKLNSSVNVTSPVVRKVEIDIIPSAIKNITVDLDDDGTIDWSWLDTLNSSNSPKVVNFTSFPTGYTTVKISAATAGQIQINNFILNSSINPIELNYTYFEDCYNCTIDFDFSESSITVSGLEFDFYGSKNYTATAWYSDLTDTKTIQIYYSDFNVSYPEGYEWYDISGAQNTSNITPYGQTDSTPIWNITKLAYDENIDIYIKTNKSVDSCLNITLSNNTNREINVINETFIFQNNTAIQLANKNILNGTAVVFNQTDIIHNPVFNESFTWLNGTPVKLNYGNLSDKPIVVFNQTEIFQYKRVNESFIWWNTTKVQLYIQRNLINGTAVVFNQTDGGTEIGSTNYTVDYALGTILLLSTRQNLTQTNESITISMTLLDNSTLLEFGEIILNNDTVRNATAPFVLLNREIDYRINYTTGNFSLINFSFNNSELFVTYNYTIRLPFENGKQFGINYSYRIYNGTPIADSSNYFINYSEGTITLITNYTNNTQYGINYSYLSRNSSIVVGSNNYTINPTDGTIKLTSGYGDGFIFGINYTYLIYGYDYNNDFTFKLNTSYQQILADISTSKGIWSWENYYSCAFGLDWTWFYFASVCEGCYFDESQLDNYNIIVE